MDESDLGLESNRTMQDQWYSLAVRSIKTSFQDILKTYDMESEKLAATRYPPA
ncbi:hypothetical protein SAMN05421754_10416 [Nitrosomonas sp. Nm58]|nr:hypothetical protein SAMN05421754_10416 [Nitrosomonas sp. Nm58]